MLMTDMCKNAHTHRETPPSLMYIFILPLPGLTRHIWLFFIMEDVDLTQIIPLVST